MDHIICQASRQIGKIQSTKNNRQNVTTINRSILKLSCFYYSTSVLSPYSGIQDGVAETSIVAATTAQSPVPGRDPGKINTAPWRRVRSSSESGGSSGENSDSSATSTDSSDDPSPVPFVTVHTTPVTVPCVVISNVNYADQDAGHRKYPWRTIPKNAMEHAEDSASQDYPAQGKNSPCEQYDDHAASDSEVIAPQKRAAQNNRVSYPWRTNNVRDHDRSISPASISDAEIAAIFSTASSPQATEESMKTINVAKTLPLHESLVSALALDGVAAPNTREQLAVQQNPYVGYSPKELAESLQISAIKSGLDNFNSSDPNMDMYLRSVPIENVQEMVEDLDRRLDRVAAQEPTLSNTHRQTTTASKPVRSPIPDQVYPSPNNHEKPAEIYVDGPLRGNETIYINTSQPMSAEALAAIKQRLFGNPPVEENTYQRIFDLTSPIMSPPMQPTTSTSERVSPKCQRKVHFADPVEHSVIEIPPNWSRRRIRRQEQRDIAAAAAAAANASTNDVHALITTPVITTAISDIQPSIIISPSPTQPPIPLEPLSVKHVIQLKQQSASSKITLVPTVPPIRPPVQKSHVTRTLSPTYSNAPSVQSANCSNTPPSLTRITYTPINPENLKKNMFISNLAAQRRNSSPSNPVTRFIQPSRVIASPVVQTTPGYSSPIRGMTANINPVANLRQSGAPNINVSITHKRADQLIPTRFEMGQQERSSPVQTGSANILSSQPIEISYSSPPTYEESMRSKSRQLHKEDAPSPVVGASPIHHQKQMSPVYVNNVMETLTPAPIASLTPRTPSSPVYFSTPQSKPVFASPSPASGTNSPVVMRDGSSPVPLTSMPYAPQPPPQGYMRQISRHVSPIPTMSVAQHLPFPRQAPSPFVNTAVNTRHHSIAQGMVNSINTVKILCANH